MKKLIIPFCFIALAALFFSCTSSDDANEINSSVDVYVSGSKSDHACYWKNDQLILLPDAGAFSSSADTIIVANNNVHITGYDGNKHLYWKNNVLTNLTDSFSTATDVVSNICSMDVVNDDVYFAGITASVNSNEYHLVYWKNGIKTVVSTFSGQFYFYHIGIKVVGNDVYINAPNENSGNFSYGYYVNGAFFSMDNVNIWGCNAINSDVYIYGGLAENGFYKNITTNDETTFHTDSPIIHLCFDNGNVYCSNSLSIFKNGVSFYTIPENTIQNPYFYNMNTFTVVNDSVYAITETAYSEATNFILVQKLLIDDVVRMQNATDERFYSLFVVAN